MRVLVSCCIVLCGCPNPADDTDGTPSGPDPLESVFPAASAADVFSGTTVEALFDDEVPLTAEPVLTVAGVSGTAAWFDDQLFRFTPDAPLAPDTSYDATVEYGDRSFSWTFSTGDVGPSVDPAQVYGRTYALDLTSGRFVTPRGVDELVAAGVSAEVLLEFNDDDKGFDVIAGTAEEGDAAPTQDLCIPTADFELELDDNPYWHTTEAAIATRAEGIAVPILIDDVSGGFAPDGAYIDGVTLHGVFDTRALSALWGDDAPPETFCNSLDALATECIDCPDGSGPYCAEFVKDSMRAAEVAAPVEVVTEACDENDG